MFDFDVLEAEAEKRASSGEVVAAPCHRRVLRIPPVVDQRTKAASALDTSTGHVVEVSGNGSSSPAAPKEEPRSPSCTDEASPVLDSPGANLVEGPANGCNPPGAPEAESLTLSCEDREASALDTPAGHAVEILAIGSTRPRSQGDAASGHPGDSFANGSSTPPSSKVGSQTPSRGDAANERCIQVFDSHAQERGGNASTLGRERSFHWRPEDLEVPRPEIARGSASVAVASAQHLQAADDFVAVFLQMRRESPSGCRYLAGVRRIFRALPTCQQNSPYDGAAEPDATARCLLATLSRDTETLKDLDGPAPPSQREAFLLISAHAEVVLQEASGPLDHLSEAGGDWMQNAVPFDPAVDNPKLTLFQRLVYLPLVMYVRNTVHLYEMLDRLKAQAEGTGRSVAQLRRLLDGEGTRTESPYSWLVYGIIGALQTLLCVRQRIGWERFPLEVLASSPPPTSWIRGERKFAAGGRPPEEGPECFHWHRVQCGNSEPMQPVGTFRQGDGLMYRGIWMPEAFGEDQLRFQYSFQSFSRSVQGVMRVLKFYSGVAQTKVNDVAAGGRILLYIARDWPASPWVMPVQFFDGPKKAGGGSEEELLLPPFMVYHFEESYSIDGDMDGGRKASILDEVQEEWQVELPTKLVNFIHGSITNLNHTRLESSKAAVYVRFIRCMAPAAPVARLLTDPACFLYGWSSGLSAGGSGGKPEEEEEVSEKQPGTYVVLGRDVGGGKRAEVRSAPSHRAQVLGLLNAGDVVQVACKLPRSPWWRLAASAPGIASGYVHRCLLAPSDGGVAVPKT